MWVFALQWLSFSLFMLLVRPVLIILIMLMTGIYIDVYKSKEADVREGFPSVADDMVGIVHDNLNWGNQKVCGHAQSGTSDRFLRLLSAAAFYNLILSLRTDRRLAALAAFLFPDCMRVEADPSLPTLIFHGARCCCSLSLKGSTG